MQKNIDINIKININSEIPCECVTEIFHLNTIFINLNLYLIISVHKVFHY